MRALGRYRCDTEFGKSVGSSRNEKQNFFMHRHAIHWIEESVAVVENGNADSARLHGCFFQGGGVLSGMGSLGVQTWRWVRNN